MTDAFIQKTVFCKYNKFCRNITDCFDEKTLTNFDGELPTNFDDEESKVSFTRNPSNISRLTDDDSSDEISSTFSLSEQCRSNIKIRCLDLSEHKDEEVKDILTSWVAEVNTLIVSKEYSRTEAISHDQISESIYNSVRTFKVGLSSSSRNYSKSDVAKYCNTIKSYLVRFKNLEHLELFNIGFPDIIDLLSELKVTPYLSITLHRLKLTNQDFNMHVGEVHLYPGLLQTVHNRNSFQIEWDGGIQIYNSYRGLNASEFINREKDQFVLKNVDCLRLLGNVAVHKLSKLKVVPNLKFHQRSSKISMKFTTKLLDWAYFPEMTLSRENWNYIRENLDGKERLRISVDSRSQKETLVNHANKLQFHSLSTSMYADFGYFDEQIFQNIASSQFGLHNLNIKIADEEDFDNVMRTIRGINISGNVFIMPHEACKGFWMNGMTSLVSKDKLNATYRPDIIYK